MKQLTHGIPTRGLGPGLQLPSQASRVGAPVTVLERRAREVELLAMKVEVEKRMLDSWLRWWTGEVY